MKKIFELTEKEFLTGIAPSSQLQTGGLWYLAKGITFVRNIFTESQDVGLLEAGPAPTNLTGSVVVDVPYAWASNVSGVSTHDLFVWGNAGHLYRIDISGDNTPTDVSSGAAVSNPANGLTIFQPRGGTRYVFYWQKQQIGRWDPTAAWATRTDNWKTGLQNTDRHGTHRFQDRVYYGNGNLIGYIGDDGAADTEHVANALDFETDERVDCLSDDGVYLVAGLSKSQYADSLVQGQSRIIFWDTNQSSWQREWPIPDAAVLSIRRVGGMMEALTSRGVFRFNFDTPPEPVLPYLSGDSLPAAGPSFPSQFLSDALPAALLWGAAGSVASLGKITPQMPTALLLPLSGFDGNVTMVCATARTNNVFVGTSTSKLYRVKWDDTPTTGVFANTIFVDLQRWYQVGKIVIEFSKQLGTGDEMRVQAKQDTATPNIAVGTVAFSAVGAIRSKELYKSIEARKLLLSFLFDGGNPRIRRVEVWGDPLERPTHTRT